MWPFGRVCLDSVEKEMATHSSVLAWRIPGRGAWWAAVYGVAQSRTRLKRLGRSSSSRDVLGRLISVLPWSLILPIPYNMCPQMCPTFACCVPCHSQPPAFPGQLFLLSCAHSLQTHRFCDSSFSHSSGDADATHFFQGPDPLWPHPHLLILAVQICWPDFWWRKKICVCTHDACEYIVCFPSWD